ncbi:glycosyltransferase family 32 protein [Austwickia chelonae]|uniref:glycosyltransferase family 32 protein n=1 Tax=Austwickia chelonae TaxID=100225 RepID=UPI000E26D994|nr:glycosyltransferase [Austwickia chelonae]
MAVPKTLHFVWVGDDTKRPDGCIDSWRRLNPTYEIRLWGNDDVEGHDWINAGHIQQMLGHELCGVADLMRYEILFKYGGLALDADSACVRPLEDWVIEPDDFTCWSNELYIPSMLANGVMGATPRSPYVAAVINHLHQKDTVVNDRAWKTTGPVVTTKIWMQYRYPLTVWPAHLFLPDFHSGPDYAGTGPVFARQFYGSTYNDLEPGKDAYAEISSYGRGEQGESA